MIKELAEWMVSSGELIDLVIGETLFAGFLPETSTSSLYTVILERTGAAVDGYLKHARAKPVQLFTRGATYHTARDEAFRVFEWLIVKVGIQLTTFYVYGVQGVEPQYLGKSEKGQYEFSANVVLQVRKETE